MPGATTNVFISYSHSDESLVAPVVRLLRVNDSLVFQDKDRIPPGKRWREEIARALAESNLVVVFWCHHASKSEEVSGEWMAAVEQKKDLLPLLLDETPLPPALGAFQWIDFRGVVGGTHGAVDPSAGMVRPGAASAPPVAAPPVARPPSPAVKAASPRRGLRYLSVGVAAAAAVVVGLLFVPGAPTDTTRPVPGPMPPVESDSALVLWISLLVVVGALGVFILWLRRRRRTRPLRSEAASARPAGIEHLLAAEIEAAIIRRTRA
jgi:hypothetical protein